MNRTHDQILRDIRNETEINFHKTNRDRILRQQRVVEPEINPWEEERQVINNNYERRQARFSEQRARVPINRQFAIHHPVQQNQNKVGASVNSRTSNLVQGGLNLVSNGFRAAKDFDRDISGTGSKVLRTRSDDLADQQNKDQRTSDIVSGVVSAAGLGLSLL